MLIFQYAKIEAQLLMKQEALMSWKKFLEKAPPHNKGIVYQQRFEEIIKHLQQTGHIRTWFKTFQNSPLDESGIDYVINLKNFGPTPFQITSEKRRANAHRRKQRESQKQRRIPTIAIRKKDSFKDAQNVINEILIKARLYHQGSLV